jgi:YVTN family beta-propeller protein
VASFVRRDAGREFRRSWWLGAVTVVLALCVFPGVAGAAGKVPAAAGAGGNVYVANAFGGAGSSGNISQYAIGSGGLLSPLTPPALANPGAPSGVVVAPNGRSAYVTNDNSGTVSQYNIDPVTGALSSKVLATVAAGVAPLGIAVTPSGESVYVTDSSFGTVLQYNTDPVTGALSPKSPATVPAGTNPNPPFPFDSVPFNVAVTPNGKSAYVTTFFSGVLQFNIDPSTGDLSPKTPASVAGPLSEGVVVSSNGKSAYVTNINSGTVSQFDIDPVSGDLSPKTPATVPTSTGPTNGIALTPNGKSLYVLNGGIGGGAGGAGVSQYNIDPVTGGLSPKTPAAVPAAGGDTEAGAAVTPNGKNAYITNGDGTVSQYNIDPVTGGLSPKVPATIPAGSGDDALAIGR